MKILVIAQDYPSHERRYAMSYVHTRCLGYKKLGHEVSVLSFSATDEYQYEGISVYPEEKIDACSYHLIASHAPNLKNHFRYLFLMKGKRIVFFFHGHEVIKASQYPVPYEWKKIGRSGLLRSFYDEGKLFAFKFWLPWLASRNNVGFVFVSEWMRERFEENAGLRSGNVGKCRIIPNAVHDAFVEHTYQPVTLKLADFVTIRPLDESKYCMDLVLSVARANPTKTFHVYGKGEFFKHHTRPDNLTLHEEFIPQAAIPNLLNKYSCALMPTRYDAQGVMMCEMATFGIPVLTSDFSVCVEMLSGFKNVAFSSLLSFELPASLPTPSKVSDKNLRFDSSNLIKQEVDFFNEL